MRRFRTAATKHLLCCPGLRGEDKEKNFLRFAQIKAVSLWGKFFGCLGGAARYNDLALLIRLRILVESGACQVAAVKRALQDETAAEDVPDLGAFPAAVIAVFNQDRLVEFSPAGPFHDEPGFSRIGVSEEGTYVLGQGAVFMFPL